MDFNIDKVNMLCNRDKEKLLKLIENNDIDSFTRLVKLSNGKDIILQGCMMYEFDELDLNFEDLKVYLEDQDLKKSEIQRF